jgi:hypothetical protein
MTGAERARADRMIEARRVQARVDPPPELERWLIETFGSLDAVRNQTIVKVANRATGEAALIAPLRSRRPIDGPAGDDLATVVAATQGDPFCSPETGTPAHAYGRVRGAHIVTGANAAAADANHAVLVFDRHDPLDFDAELIGDIFVTGRAWAGEARQADPTASNYLLIWNCGWRAGGSIVHGHAQALVGSGPHYARLEQLRHDAERYAGDLVADLVDLHVDLDLALGLDGGVTVLAHITPIKEREILIVGGRGMDERDPAYIDAVAGVLVAYRDVLGVQAFDLALWRPPLGGEPGWEWLPPIVRIVDRGDPTQHASDIGSMEMYATPVVGTDPYEVASALRAALG